MSARPSTAFFDLDRTLLGGSSGEIFKNTLAAEGLGPSVDIPGLGAINKLFGVVGETRMSMRLAKATARAASGWSTDAVKRAAKAAVPELLDLTFSFVAAEFAMHRAEGRSIVVATSSPKQLVKPFAKALGADAVIGTRWESKDGEFTGHIEGRFVWERDKWLAVRDWCRERDIDPADCWAYSDSYFDVPMLDGVGNPVATNPDPRLAAVAALKGWPIRHLDKPDGVVTVSGFELQDFARALGRPEFIPYAKFDITGVENLPADGSALVVGNHRSYFDSTAVALVLAKSGRAGRFLGKKEVFDAPVVGQLAAAAGGIRVDRGTGAAEPLHRAIAALRSGELVALMPQGTIPRGPAFFEPELKARWGAARLAVASGAPVVPIGLWGTEKVWPRSSRLPKMDVTSPPKVTVTVGKPVDLSAFPIGDESAIDDPEVLDAVTRAIMAAIVDLLPPEAREHHTPTQDELLATYPPGYIGDPNAESDRRPGTDT
ncbi:MAG: HAD-IB family hydrolase [Actinomycetia bacterium]|nr:HAD-IB family hydrolase [Actinomycetes bacterium]MCP4961493.1 HAD-IB family hydrolase [Actinomycetes bacterium]